MPVAFDCECGNRWWSPPDVGCRICGPAATSVPDPVVWSVDRVPGTDVFLSGQLRDRERFARMLAMGMTAFVDIAGGAHYVWRPSDEEVAATGISYVEISGVEDTNTDLRILLSRGSLKRWTGLLRSVSGRWSSALLG